MKTPQERRHLPGASGSTACPRSCRNALVDNKGSKINCPRHSAGTPSRTRTCNLVLRRHLLYPLSYGGGFTCILDGLSRECQLRAAGDSAVATKSRKLAKSGNTRLESARTTQLSAMGEMARTGTFLR
jgi:hypothetical protein